MTKIVLPSGESPHTITFSKQKSYDGPIEALEEMYTAALYDAFSCPNNCKLFVNATVAKVLPTTTPPQYNVKIILECLDVRYFNGIEDTARTIFDILKVD